MKFRFGVLSLVIRFKIYSLLVYLASCLCLIGVTHLSPGQLILASSSDSVWRLLPLDFEDQIEQLVNESQFGEAKKLIQELEFASEADKDANLIRVESLEAHWMFTSLGKHEDAIDILSGLEASPLDVINLYPEFHVGDYAGSFDPSLADQSTLDSLLPLMRYLVDQRNTLSRFRGETMPLVDTLEESLYLSRIIDTTLLRVYLRVNESFAASLLRIGNFCSLEESEEILIEWKVGEGG
jgi:hypothetical protein